MDDPTRAPDPEPRSRPGRLERPPGARYGGQGHAATAAGTEPTTGGRSRSLVRALLAADLVGAIGALAIVGLGQLDVGAGLIAVAAAAGWAVALALVWGGGPTFMPAPGARAAVAAALAAGSVIAGFLIDWGWARVEGGVLDPVAYVDQRYGPLWLVVLAAAVLTAALRAR